MNNTVLYKVAEWMIRLKIFSPPPKQEYKREEEEMLTNLFLVIVL